MREQESENKIQNFKRGEYVCERGELSIRDDCRIRYDFEIHHHSRNSLNKAHPTPPRLLQPDPYGGIASMSEIVLRSRGTHSFAAKRHGTDQYMT